MVGGYDVDAGMILDFLCCFMSSLTLIWHNTKGFDSHKLSKIFYK
jgi:hypothetical protein